jgi:hypothetical protein
MVRRALFAVALILLGVPSFKVPVCGIGRLRVP